MALTIVSSAVAADFPGRPVRLCNDGRGAERLLGNIVAAQRYTARSSIAAKRVTWSRPSTLTLAALAGARDGRGSVHSQRTRLPHIGENHRRQLNPQEGLYRCVDSVVMIPPLVGVWYRQAGGVARRRFRLRWRRSYGDVEQAIARPGGLLTMQRIAAFWLIVRSARRGNA